MKKAVKTVPASKRETKKEKVTSFEITGITEAEFKGIIKEFLKSRKDRTSGAWTFAVDGVGVRCLITEKKRREVIVGEKVLRSRKLYLARLLKHGNFGS